MVPGSLGKDQDPVVQDAAQEELFCVLAALTQDKSAVQKEENVFSEAVIHQILARIQKLTQKIVLPYLTYLSSVCVQVRSVQFTGEERKINSCFICKRDFGISFQTIHQLDSINAFSLPCLLFT